MFNDKVTVLEFFGMPGVGKTTVVLNLLEALRKQSVPVYCNDDIRIKRLFRNKLNFLPHFVLFVIKRFNLSVMLIFFSLREIKLIKHSVLRSSSLLTKLVCLEYFVNKQKNRCLLILDQGVIQLGWSFIHKDKKAFENFDRICKIIKPYRGDFLVYVKSDINKNINRIKEREKNCEFKTNDVSSLKELIIKGNQLFKEVVVNKNSSALLEVDTTMNCNDKKTKNIIKFCC